MGYYIFHKDGKLIGISPFEESTTLALEGVSYDFYEEPIPDLNSIIWDSEENNIKTFKTKLSKLEFLNKFSITERVTINNSTDPVVIDIMKLFDVAEFIDITDEHTKQALGYFNVSGIISSERYQEIINASN